MRARPGVPFLSAALLVASFSVFYLACGKQGEGERCDVANGYDDCQDGLICLARGVCCPGPGVQATASDCLGTTTVVPDSGSDATDSGGGSDTGSDGGSDATDASDAPDAGGDVKDTGAAIDTGVDSPADSGTDTGVDAPADTGTADAADAG